MYRNESEEPEGAIKCLIKSTDCVVTAAEDAVFFDFIPMKRKILSVVAVPLLTSVLIYLLVGVAREWTTLNQIERARDGFLLVSLGWLLAKNCNLIWSKQCVQFHPSRNFYHWKERTLLGWRDESGEYIDDVRLRIQYGEPKRFGHPNHAQEVWITLTGSALNLRVARGLPKKEAGRLEALLSNEIGSSGPLWKQRQDATSL